MLFAVKTIALALIINTHILYAQTQSVRFERFSPEDGLSNSVILSIIQDKTGFIWIGTQNGLNRYDGYTFTVYKHKPSDSNSLSDNYVRSIIETKDSLLWIATENGGLNMFDPETEKFTHYFHNESNPGTISTNKLNVIYEDPDSEGILWIGSNGEGLDKFDYYNNRFIHYTRNSDSGNSISNNYIRAILKDKYGALWIGTNEGLNRFDINTGKWTTYLHDSENPNSISSSEAKILYEDAEEILWVGTDYGVNRIIRPNTVKGNLSRDKEKIKFEFIEQGNSDRGTNSGSITAIYEDKQRILWIGEHYGLHKYDRTTGKFLQFNTQSNNPHSISGDLINYIYEDRSGLLWIGTEGSGISILNPQAKNFTLMSSIPGNPNSLSSSSIRGIYEDDEGILWVGGYKGLNRIDRKLNKITHFMPENSGLNSDFIYAVCPDNVDKNILWVGTEGDGLYKFYKNSGNVEKFNIKADNPVSPFSIKFIFDLYIDSFGMLWLATKSGLIEFNKRTGDFTVYLHNPDDSASISDNELQVIFEDSRGLLWIGTIAGGLNRFNRKTGKFKQFIHNPDDPLSISNNRIKSIYEDKTGEFWIGTNGAGLNRFDRKTETFEHFTQKDGLPDDVIYGILEDEKGNLWLSTNNGISRFNPKPDINGESKSRFKNYNVSDGLQSSEFNTASYFKSKSGEMFFGGINGLNSFYPNKILDYSYIPPVVITDFQIYNKSVPIGLSFEGRVLLRKNISKTKAIKLSYKDGMISFEFTALNFIAPEKNKYAYMLEGYDKEWIFAEADRRYATYSHLEPGEYIFKVKGSNNDGFWNKKTATVGIIISPPFWKTWWAYSLYSILIIGSIFGFIHYKTLKYAAELEVQAKIKLAKAEERILVQKETSKDFHDELGNKFTKISLFGELAKRNTFTNPDETINYLNQVIRTSKDLSGSMRDFIWTLDSEQNSLYDVGIRLKDFGETLFNSFGIKFFMLGLSEQLYEIKLKMNRRRNIVFIFKEAMNNILKYAKPTAVTLEFESNAHKLNICITDDGIGFDSGQITTGYGLRNMKSRAKNIGGALKIKSSPGNGTSVCLIVNFDDNDNII